MPQSKNITIAVGDNHQTYEGAKMMPIVQDYPDYIAVYNISSSDVSFFNETLKTRDSNIYAFFKPGISFATDSSIGKIAQAFDKDPGVMAVVCDGFFKNNTIKHKYYLNTNQFADINKNIPMFFHKNIAKNLVFQENPYEELIKIFNTCLSQQKLVIHIAEPLIVINE
jgi:hypothetical protein